MGTRWFVFWNLLAKNAATMPTEMHAGHSSSPDGFLAVEVNPDTTVHATHQTRSSNLIRREVVTDSNSQRRSESAGVSASKAHTVSINELEVRRSDSPVASSTLLHVGKLLEAEDPEDHAAEVALFDKQIKPTRADWCLPGYYDDLMCQSTPAPTTTPRPVSCEWAPWEHWDDCSATCGGGYKERVRSVSRPAKHGGHQCQGPDIETRKCNEVACAAPTTTSSALAPTENSSDEQAKSGKGSTILILSICGGSLIVLLGAYYIWMSKSQAKKQAQMMRGDGGLASYEDDAGEDEFAYCDDDFEARPTY